MNKPAKQQSATKQRKGCLGWLKEVLILSLLAVVMGWGVDLWRNQNMTSTPAENLLTESLSGKRVDLNAMSQERPVLLYFWASWCAICTTVSPSVDLIAQHYQVVTIALSSGDRERIQYYLNDRQYHFDVVNDPLGEISRTWGVTVTPTIVVIDKGEIRSVTSGFTSPLGIWLRLLLA